MQPTQAHINLSTAGGLAAILLWSTTFALARSLSEQVGPLQAGAAVYLLGGAMGLMRLRKAGVPGGRFCALSPRYLWGCGSLFVLYSALLYVAIGLARDRDQLLEVALVNYLWPAATVVLSVPLLHKRASLMLLPGTLLALAGVFLVMTQGALVSWSSFWRHLQGNPAAYGLMVVAALAWALYSNLARRWSAPNQGGATEWFVTASGLVLGLVSLATPGSTVWTGRALGEAAALGAITALAYALWDVAMRRGNLVLVAAASYLTPLLSTLVSCAYLKVTPGSQLWTGCALLVLGSILSWRSVSEREFRPARAAADSPTRPAPLS